MDIRQVDGRWVHTPVADRKEYYVYAQDMKIEVPDYKKALEEQKQDVFNKCSLMFCKGYSENHTIYPVSIKIEYMTYDRIVPMVLVQVDKMCMHGNGPKFYEYAFTPSKGWIRYNFSQSDWSSHDNAVYDEWMNMIYRERLEKRIVALEQDVANLKCSKS
jgi:hypothetical protein